MNNKPMSTLKKVLLSVCMLLLTTYLCLAFTVINRTPLAGEVCADLVVNLTNGDSDSISSLGRKELDALLKKNGVYPVGKVLDSVNTAKLEDVIGKHPLVEKVDCYKTPSGKIGIDIHQRVPILRVIAANGENYYVDSNGSIMPLQAVRRGNPKASYHLPVVTGRVEKAFAAKQLHDFALFLHSNSFWNAQIEQINVLQGNRIELVPRVGDHIIYLGAIDQYERKLSRLKEFYSKALNKVGWTKYSRINVEFANQIICTKKEQ